MTIKKPESESKKSAWVAPVLREESISSKTQNGNPLNAFNPESAFYVDS